MRQLPALLGVAVCAALLTGCVDRKYVINSNPTGAVVYVNDVQIGATPVENHFVYYGDYEFLLVKEGYQTLRKKVTIPPPWYEYFPIDFFSEVLWPCRQLDVHRFETFVMEPLPAVRTDVLIDDAQKLRARGQAITPPPSETPLPPLPPAAGPPAVVGNRPRVRRIKPHRKLAGPTR